MDVFVTRSQPDLGFLDIRPGDWVVIKPNLVKECKENDPSQWECVITSPTLIGFVCEYVCRRLGGRGRVTICDAPQTDSSFEKIARLLDLDGIAGSCRRAHGIEIEVVDLRNEEWVSEAGIVTKRYRLPGDPRGAVAFNLGEQSLFYGYRGEGHYYGADYDSSVVNGHHNGKTHEYLICATPILADVFINLPKLKTHKKAGVTLSLKNLVGINADKNWLPHHTEGSPRDYGDQFPDMRVMQMIEQGAVHFARRLALGVPGLGPIISQKLRSAGTVAFGEGDKVIRSGNWHGNDTTWRMALDLNRCLLYGNPDGTLRDEGPKRHYSIIDGTIGMEGIGPMQGEPVASNVVIGGADAVAVDMVAARVMGFDWRKIPIIREAFGKMLYPITHVRPEDVNVRSDIPGWGGRFIEIIDRKFLKFKPHFGWAGHIEYERVL
ncbi:conserved hypothetical protein [Syntrophobacter sp. SbD1]|nr:conserved hypothetical protein [Syntrophobacter sp. SbD1]